HRPQTLDIHTRMLVPANLHLDRTPTAFDHAPRPLGRLGRLDRADDELQADAALTARRRNVAATQQLVHRYAKDLSLQVEQRHLNRRAGEAVAKRRALHAPLDPFG